MYKLNLHTFFKRPSFLFQPLVCLSWSPIFMYFRGMLSSHRLSFWLLGTCCWALAACSSYEEPDSGIECGRQFINATYQGNFKRAKQLLVPTAANKQWLADSLEQVFRAFNGAQKEALSKASIVIAETQNPSDSVVLIRYINAYNQWPRTLRCVWIDGVWRTDLQHSFSSHQP